MSRFLVILPHAKDDFYMVNEFTFKYFAEIAPRRHPDMPRDKAERPPLFSANSCRPCCFGAAEKNRKKKGRSDGQSWKQQQQQRRAVGG